MDVVLLTLTTLSLAAATGFAALSWRVGREERERSRARIAALATAWQARVSPEATAGQARVSPEATAGQARISPEVVASQARLSSKTSAAPRVAVGSVFDRGNEGLRGGPTIKLAAGGIVALAI